ncbi:hypothetical protein GCM10007857_51710 [Bradyrhizobium iriomotense]|uniref:PepSY domain-containing protein n=2 Tax=Bradyrhizobium iriomotense TaxID=441950 RepID=A0ABQ6B4T0_9BRAD|nr:hypothetical protein GCM10007857_51710 [Bradyrhizobium iriomotense]
MRRSLLAAAALALLISTASAGDFRAADIAKLPQDKVAVIKANCAKEWGDNFRLREYCEDLKYEALQNLISRGSIGPKGERL